MADLTHANSPREPSEDSPRDLADDPANDLAEDLAGAAFPQFSAEPWAAPVPDESPKPRFATLPEFVEEYLVEIAWKDIAASSRTWCREWWRHPAAIVRLDALWRSFEALRLDPATGMSVWLRDHADVHMAVLLDGNDGPFKGCKPDEHDDARDRILPVRTPPPGLFTEDD